MPTIQAAVDRYLDANPQGSYPELADTALSRFQQWCRAREYNQLTDLDPDQYAKAPLRAYAQDLRDDPDLADASARVYYNVLRACLGYAVRDGLLETNYADRNEAVEELPDPDRDRESQQYWSEEQIATILRYVRERAHEAIDEDGFAATQPVRDRALVELLVFSGVRGAEVFRDPRDDHRGRQGLRWERVELDQGTIRVFGKAREWESASLLPQCHAAIERHRDLQKPASDDWPVFATRHRPTLHAYVREEIDGGASLLEDADPMDVLRDHDVAPPALTTEGARSVMKRLCEDAGIEPDEGYLQLHGARRSLGRKLYQEDTALSQNVLRHRSPDVTSEAYAHVDASERAEEAGDVVGDEWGS